MRGARTQKVRLIGAASRDSDSDQHPNRQARGALATNQEHVGMATARPPAAGARWLTAIGTAVGTAIGATLWLAAVWVAPAHARPAAKPAGPSLEEIAIMLSSSNGDEVRMAIEASAGLGSPDVIPMIAERVRAGLPSDLLDAAIDSLMLLGDPGTADVFEELATHRRPSVRLRAVQALIAQRSVGLRGKRTESILVNALGDSNPAVREAAADGLGEIGAKGSISTLFRALDRDVLQAARAVGRLASERDLPRILGYLGHVPMTNLTPMFDAFLVRRDVNEAAKLQVVVQLEELGTAEARGYLEKLSTQLPPDSPARLRRAIEDAVARIAS